MKPHPMKDRLLRVAPALILSGFLTLGALAGRSEAGLVIKALDGSAVAGGSGAFDVVLVNEPGSDSYDVSGFSIRLSVASASGVLFTGVTDATATAPYIFGSEQFPPFSDPDPFPTTAFTASDFVLDVPGVTLGPDQTVGLLRVSFTVASTAAAGVVPVSIVLGAATEINDPAGAPLDFQAIDGSLDITRAPVIPEPSSLAPLAIAGGSLLGWRRWRGMAA